MGASCKVTAAGTRALATAVFAYPPIAVQRSISYEPLPPRHARAKVG